MLSLQEQALKRAGMRAVRLRSPTIITLAIKAAADQVKIGKSAPSRRARLMAEAALITGVTVPA